MHKLNIDFNVKSVSKKNDTELVKIEGFANKAVTDRIGDLVEPKGGRFENFLKNPVMLFNHDHNYPIGKFKSVEAREDGVYVKGELSTSKDPKISYVRDLVREGVLKTFSIGFNAMKDTMEGEIKKITDWELHEVSVVSVPMNQDSTFVMSKNWSECSYQEARAEVLESKGALVARALHDRLYELQSGDEGGPEFDREATLESAARAAEISREELDQILAGNVTPVDEAVLQALAEAMEIDPESLLEFNKADAEEPESEDESEEQPAEGDAQSDEAQEREGEESTSGMKPKDEEKSEVTAEGTDGAATTGIGNESPLKNEDPHLALAMQNNVLLGQLIAEVQGIAKMMMKDQEMEEAEEMAEGEEPESEMPQEMSEAEKAVESSVKKIETLLKDMGF